MTRRLLTLVVLTAVTALALAGVARAKTVWLCRPGLAHDPCTAPLSTTVYSPSLQPLKVTHPRRQHPSVDCFYVYPTVSDETTALSDRVVHPEERSIALYQAARFSQVCRVFAPMYRQVTVPELQRTGTETRAQLRIPLHDVTAAFEDYLHHDNHGRPFVLIGHSQGAFLLEQLIRDKIDSHPVLRRDMLSAILLGGNVLVRDGRRAGGTFRHVPACAGADSLSCVIAFSTFDAPVPADSLFGRSTVPGEHVLCVNPDTKAFDAEDVRARPALDPIEPSAPFAPGTLIGAGISLLHLTLPHPATTWISLRGDYTARCSSAGGANVLQVTPVGGAQLPTPSPDAAWGLHLLDANVELGNLVGVVGAQYDEWADTRFGH